MPGGSVYDYMRKVYAHPVSLVAEQMSWSAYMQGCTTPLLQPVSAFLAFLCMMTNTLLAACCQCSVLVACAAFAMSDTCLVLI